MRSSSTRKAVSFLASGGGYGTMLLLLMISMMACDAFAPPSRRVLWITSSSSSVTTSATEYSRPISSLQAAVPDLDVVGLVVGQENYGLAVVAVGEALWSFAQAPSFDHAKVLIPAAVAALVLSLVSGPMVTSGDMVQVGTGLGIATAVSVGLGVSYVLRLLAPFSPSPKEIAFLGLLVAVAGFFSFSQNLLVDGFVTLPSIPLPSLPSIELPFN